MLAHPDVQLVVNLTTPDAHVEVSSAAIAAGKHVWSEKPLGLDREAIASMLEQARAAGVRVGSRPTPCSARASKVRSAIAVGIIGEPLFAQTAFQTQGPDSLAPEPRLPLRARCLPLLDMGPYYFSALVSLLGPVDRVAAVGMNAKQEREIRTGPNAGSMFTVEVPSTMQVLTAFEAGTQAESLLSFDSPLERHGILEIHGTEGSILLPDPNRFTGRTAHVKPLGVLRDGMSVDQPWIEVEERGTVVGRGSACSTWCAPSRAIGRTLLPVSWATTSSTCCCQRRSRPHRSSSSRSRARSRRLRCCRTTRPVRVDTVATASTQEPAHAWLPRRLAPVSPPP